MKVFEHYGIGDAPICEGHVVVIDVLRAFTTAAFAFNQGAEQIFLVATEGEAHELRRRNPDFLLVGESGGVKIEGFDFGNSPEDISRQKLSGKTLVLRSSSGTQGVVNASRAKQIYLGSLVVASATVDHLMAQQIDVVSLLAMGSLNGPDKEEDIACRTYMNCLLHGEHIDESVIVEQVRNCPAGLMALDHSIAWKTPGDLECAVSIDKFTFAMPVLREGSQFIARRLDL